MNSGITRAVLTLHYSSKLFKSDLKSSLSCIKGGYSSTLHPNRVLNTSVGTIPYPDRDNTIHLEHGSHSHKPKIVRSSETPQNILTEARILFIKQKKNMKSFK